LHRVISRTRTLNFLITGTRCSFSPDKNVNLRCTNSPDHSYAAVPAWISLGLNGVSVGSLAVLTRMRRTGIVVHLTSTFAGLLPTVRRLPATKLALGARLRLVLTMDWLHLVYCPPSKSHFRTGDLHYKFTPVPGVPFHRSGRSADSTFRNFTCCHSMNGGVTALRSN
jgi:hypothetical protein